jgi:hypothetical protein
MAEIARKTQVITGVSPIAYRSTSCSRPDNPRSSKAWRVTGRWCAAVSNHRRAPSRTWRVRGQTPITVFVGHPDIAGRFFYNDEFTGFNFKALKAPLGDTLDRLQAQLGDAGAPSIYVGSTTWIFTCRNCERRTISRCAVPRSNITVRS